MEQVIAFLSDYGDLIQIGIMVLFYIILFFVTKDKKYIKEVLESMIKYRTNNQTPADFKPQEFTNLKPVYRLNKATGELELTDEVIDIQELVNSCKDVALNAVLERFLPTMQVNEQLVEVAKMEDDVDKMRDALMLADSYRDKYNLPLDMSATEIFRTVQDKSIELKNKVEVLKNEKKNDEESK